MSKINYIFLDDNKDDFKTYTAKIDEVLQKMGIPHNLKMTYEQGICLMDKYWQYLKDGDDTALNNAVRDFKLMSEDMICFIDDNWDNTSSSDNCDGKNFVATFLNDNMQQNVIMVTVNPDSYPSAYTKKNRQFKNKLQTALTKVAPYKKYQEKKEKPNEIKETTKSKAIAPKHYEG